MKKLKIKIRQGVFEEVQGQLFTVHFPEYTGSSAIAWQFFYHQGKDGTIVVSDKISGLCFNAFKPVSNTKEGRTGEAKAAVHARLSQYGCEKVTKLLKNAGLSPLN